MNRDNSTDHTLKELLNCSSAPAALVRVLRPKEKKLAQLCALLDVAKQRPLLPVGGRGRMHEREIRKTLLHLVCKARAAGAQLKAACQILGISPRTIQRWSKQGAGEDQRPRRRYAPPNRLSEGEQRQVLAVLKSQEYQGLSPRHIVAKLADQGIYLASESTMHRLLRSRRQPSAPSPTKSTVEPALQLHVADRPNKVWSWDISRLKSTTRGIAFYLYLVMDVFSRRIMGWHVSHKESMRTAAHLIQRLCVHNKIGKRELVLHSDNGGPMRSATMRAMLHRLGVTPSFSRPRMSSDNAYSESLFSTLKGQSTYPHAFSALEEARAWMIRFAVWYNRQHLHSGISFVTPDARHFGREYELLARRRQVYEAARSMRPERWSRSTRTWAPAGPSLVRTPMPPVDVRLSLPPLPSKRRQLP